MMPKRKPPGAIDKRSELAAHAMHALIVARNYDWESCVPEDCRWNKLAKMSWDAADAMLTEEARRDG